MKKTALLFLLLACSGCMSITTQRHGDLSAITKAKTVSVTSNEELGRRALEFALRGEGFKVLPDNGDLAIRFTLAEAAYHDVLVGDLYSDAYFEFLNHGNVIYAVRHECPTGETLSGIIKTCVEHLKQPEQ